MLLYYLCYLVGLPVLIVLLFINLSDEQASWDIIL